MTFHSLKTIPLAAGLLFASCLVDAQPGVNSSDWGDPDAYPDLGGAFASLTALNGTCSFASMTGIMSINANNAAQTIIIGLRPVDSAVLVNGRTCGSPAATKTTLKVMNINQGMTGNQVVILDFVNGTFAPGTAAARGINSTSVPVRKTSCGSAERASRMS